MTIESNWSDRPEDRSSTRQPPLFGRWRCCCARATWIDVDCWSEVQGQPIKPGTIAA